MVSRYCIGAISRRWIWRMACHQCDKNNWIQLLFEQRTFIQEHWTNFRAFWKFNSWERGLRLCSATDNTQPANKWMYYGTLCGEGQAISSDLTSCDCYPWRSSKDKAYNLKIIGHAVYEISREELWTVLNTVHQVSIRCEINGSHFMFMVPCIADLY